MSRGLRTPSRAAFVVAPTPAARDLRGNGRKAR